ncbi:MAG: hypothetical protein E6Q93_08035 [Burkholderiaceae bacterium]|nr:MAG: hypothetical protein E6Q93_08035 [Burkholderiaceae bacterium]
MRALTHALGTGLMALVAVPSEAATLYLCKAYSGGSFWSTAACSTQQATIERMVTVPDGMPFEQQVQLGNQAAAEGVRLAAPPPAARPQAQPQSVQAPAPTDECPLLDERIRRLDSMARQPQTGATQDWIAERRREARSRQFQLRCR